MAKEKPGVMIYWETFDMFDRLKVEKLKQLLYAIRNFSQYGEVPDFKGDESLELVWPLIQQKISADSERYEKIREARTEAGRKGGLARAENLKQMQANEADANSDKQIKPTSTATATSTATSAPTTEATATTTAEEGKRDKGERENGLTLTSQPQHTIPFQTDLEFEEKRREKLEAFNKALEEREKEKQNGLGAI